MTIGYFSLLLRFSATPRKSGLSRVLEAAYADSTEIDDSAASFEVPSEDITKQSMDDLPEMNRVASVRGIHVSLGRVFVLRSWLWLGKLAGLASIGIAFMMCMSGCDHPPPPEQMALGKQVYRQAGSCVTCHQSVGQGMSELYPPLRKNPSVVHDDPERLIKIVTHGLAGPMEVNGQDFGGIMAGLGHQLTPEEIAAVLTYIRNSWGNQASAVTVDQVVSVQEEHAGRTTPWTAEELHPDTALRDVASALDRHAASAQDAAAWGESLYLGAAQCASCHQPNGQGVPGAMPPLAGSPWVTGDSDRLIKIALHGVAGEMEVLGHTYHAEMPGQGELLDNEQMAATLTYVRQAWGNESSPIYPDQVARLRERFIDRREPWDAAVLASTDNASPLNNVRYRRLEPGEQMPVLEGADFDQLEELSRGNDEKNYIRVVNYDIPGWHDGKPLLAVFEAEFEVEAEDLYTYDVESSGRAVVTVNDTVVINRPAHKGWLFRESGQIRLKPGTHRLRVAYGVEGSWRVFKLSAHAESVNSAQWMLTPGITQALALVDPRHVLVPPTDRPLLQRGRFEGQGDEGIAVGHPLRVNYCYDFDRAQLTRMWRNEFINAGAFWIGRNEIVTPPAGDRVLDLSTRPPIAWLGGADAEWPAAPPIGQRPEYLDYRGYALVNHLPVFFSHAGGKVLRDQILPQGPTDSGLPSISLRRTLQVFGQVQDQELYALIAEGGQVKAEGGGVYLIDGGYRVRVDDDVEPVVRQLADRELLVAPAAWKSTSIDLPEWTLRGTSLRSGELGYTADWGYELFWVEMP
ncbi:MAG: cytochrome c [Planctomycetota bacterium]